MPTLEEQKHHLRGLKAPGNGPLLRAETEAALYDVGLADGKQEAYRYMREAVVHECAMLDEQYGKGHKHGKRVDIMKAQLRAFVKGVEERIYG